MKTIFREYKSRIKPVWCPGCGDYGVLTGLQKTLAGLEIPPERVVVVSGIGCSGRLSHYMNTYSLHGTHGRAVPTSLGVKAARPDLTVITVGGDGDGLGIGGGHISHAARKNVDLTYLMIDNRVYGLTKGQASPTTPVGRRTKTSPYGTYEDTLEAVVIFLAYGVSFVARSGVEPGPLSEILKQAVTHRGMSIVHVISPCFSFPVLDFKTATRLMAPLPEDHDCSNRLLAMERAYSADPLYTGVFYRVERPTLGDRLDEDVRRAETDVGGHEATMEQLLGIFS
jgi:2-oxoglutarate ferredoxin oxidoreductase subunit beta